MSRIGNYSVNVNELTVAELRTRATMYGLKYSSPQDMRAWLLDNKSEEYHDGRQPRGRTACRRENRGVTETRRDVSGMSSDEINDWITLAKSRLAEEGYHEGDYPKISRRKSRLESRREWLRSQFPDEFY
jgi:hypothetical protein